MHHRCGCRKPAEDRIPTSFAETVIFESPPWGLLGAHSSLGVFCALTHMGRWPNWSITALHLPALCLCRWKCPNDGMMGAGSLPWPHSKAAEVHSSVLITSDQLHISTGWIPVDAGGKGLRGRGKLGLELGVMLSSALPASVGTSPGYLKYLLQHRGARQSPAVCRTRVGQFDLPTSPWPGFFIAADVLTNHRSIQLLFESYSFLNKSDLVITLEDEKLLRLTSGYRLQKVSCICMLTQDINVG